MDRSLRPRALLLFTLLLNVACDEQPPGPLEPKFQVGALEGFVRAAGEPIDVLVGARLVVSPYTVAARTRTDATGWYRLELPVDRYRIEIDPSNGSFFSPDTSDVVRVEAWTQRYDILRGDVTLRLAAPAVPEGRIIRCVLDCDDWRCRRNGQAAVHDGLFEYHFGLVNAGTYRVSLDQSSSAPFWLPGTPDREAADTIVVPVDRPVVYQGALDQYTSISGSIRGSWETPGATHPRVQALTPDSTAIGSTVIGMGGSFWIDLFIAQPVKLRVGNFGIEQWIGGDTFESATVFELQPGVPLEGISFVESGISCLLVSPNPLMEPRAQFLLRDERGRIYRPDGSYQNPTLIPNLLPGRYYLYVYGFCDYDGEPWGSQWYGGAGSSDSATPIDLPSGQMVPITVPLVAGATIEGRVLSLDRRPAPTSVWVFDSSGAPLCQRATANDATFSFVGVGDGDYYLAVPLFGDTWWYPGTLRFEAAQPVEVRNQANVTGIAWRFPVQ